MTKNKGASDTAPISEDDETLTTSDDADSEETLLSDGAKPTHADLIPPELARTMSYAFKFKSILEKGLKEVLSEEGTDKKRAEFKAEIEKTLKELEQPEQAKPMIDANMLILTSRKLSIGLDALSIAALSLQKDVDLFTKLLKKEPAPQPATPQTDQPAETNKK